jgi:hypothetical protein
MGSIHGRDAIVAQTGGSGNDAWARSLDDPKIKQWTPCPAGRRKKIDHRATEDTEKEE